MGDVVSLVEKAQEVIDENEAKSLEEKIKSQKFDLNDFLKQLQTIKRLGSLGGILKLIPGMPKIDDLAPAEKEMKKVGVDGFYKIWVRKEAYAKMTGDGIFGASFPSVLTGESGHYFTEIEISDGMKCAFCTPQPLTDDFDIKVLG